MRYLVAFCFLSAVVAAQPTKISPKLHALKKASPSTLWDAESVRFADVDCDGKPDLLVLGKEKGTVVIGVSWGDPRKKATVQKFPVGQSSQDSFCSGTRKIEIFPQLCDDEGSPLPGCRKVAGCQSFDVTDDDCDPFMFYWDLSQKKLAWWRH